MAGTAASLAMPTTTTTATEYFDVLNEIGAKTGIVKARNHVHRDGDYRWPIQPHVFILCLSCILPSAAQETGTELYTFGCMFKAQGICSFKKELPARSLGLIFGTFPQQGMVRPCCKMCVVSTGPSRAMQALMMRNNTYTAVTAGDQSLETAQRETHEELGVQVPAEVRQPNFCMAKSSTEF